jgi:Spy/CpxP family protein refolding chaperone
MPANTARHIIPNGVQPMSNLKTLPRLGPPLAALALSLLAGTALAGEPPADGAPRAHHLGPPGAAGGMYAGLVLHHAAAIGLSQEQTDTIKGFADSGRATGEQRRSQMHAQMQLLMQTRPDDATYSTVVAKAAQVMGDLTSQGIQQESQLRAQIWSVLTAAQRQKVTDLEATMRQRFEHGEPPPGH